MAEKNRVEALSDRWNLCLWQVGQVINPIAWTPPPFLKPQFKKVIVQQPARLQATVIDLRHIARPIRPGVYISGAITFSANFPTIAHIEAIEKPNVLEINAPSGSHSLVRHTAMIMQAAMRVNDGLKIEVKSHKWRHVGLGSSTAIQTAVASAINILYGNPIPPVQLIRYLAQNYGEDMPEDPRSLVPVQSTGSGAACGLLGGGMIVIAGEATVIKRTPIPDWMSFVFAVPPVYRSKNSLEAFTDETKVFDEILGAAEERALRMAYEVLHRLLPAMSNGDWSVIGDVLWHLRSDYGSFDRLDMMNPGFKTWITQIAEARIQGLTYVLSPSSAGPGVFALTDKPCEMKEFFERHGASTLVLSPDNRGIQIETQMLG